LAHADAWGRASRRANGVRASLVTTVDDPTYGDRLSGPEGEFLGEISWHVERDRRRVGAQLVYSGNREVPEFAARGRGRLASRHLKSPSDTRTVRGMTCSDRAHGTRSHRMRTAGLCRPMRIADTARLAPIGRG